MAKLDPDNYKSAKDVLDEQQAAQRKRKREEEGGISDVEGVDQEKPLDCDAKKRKKTKKQKREDKGDVSILTKDLHSTDAIPKGPLSDDESQRKAKAEKAKRKKELKNEKAKGIAAKVEAKKDRKTQEAALQEEIKAGAIGPSDKSDNDDDNITSGMDLDGINIKDILPNGESRSSSTATPSPLGQSPGFDSSKDHSGSSSISSIPPSMSSILPSIASESQRLPSKTPTTLSTTNLMPKPDPAELQARLQSRIEELRANRKADGLNGAPARNRQELLEARRQKENARKAHKKEIRRKAKEEEACKKAETIARGSPLLSPGSPMSSSADPITNSFSFGRVDFGDGQRASANLNAILEHKGRVKGPSDPATALIAARNKQSHFAGLDAAKQADIAEKDVWLNAKKRAQGERLRDDTSLLKKTLKRKQKQKKKSEKEWGNRIEGLQKGQEMKQKKREANLAKRKDEKGARGKKNKKPKAPRPDRPGFEGSFIQRGKPPNGDGKRRR